MWQQRLLRRLAQFVGLILLIATHGFRPVIAEPHPQGGKTTTIDTEHMFGFLTGTDIGSPGDRELETETSGRFGKRTGSYQVISQSLAFEYTPTNNLRFELGALFGSTNLSGVNGLTDVRQRSFQGLSLQMRYRLLERQRSTFGLTILAEPHWARVDEVSGQPVTQYGAALAILMDKEIVPGRIVALLNLLYVPETSQLRVTGAWSRDATLGVGAAVMAQASPRFFVGIEARYLRAYENLNLDGFAGQALFLGPNIFFRPSDRWRVTAAWSFQVTGKAAHDPAPLDLTNFERQQFKLRVGYQF